MSISFLEKHEKKGMFKLLVKGVDLGYFNSLRRIMNDEVPTLAIEDVEFVENSSILYDEVISHRLGLIPLDTDLKSYNIKSECKCKGEGCARCSVQLSLRAKGPDTVYASEIKSKDPKVKPVHPKIPIVKLLNNQNLSFNATAVLGQGKEHVKWSSGHYYFQFGPQIEIEAGKIDEETAQKVVEECPKNVFEVKAKKLSIIKENQNNCHLCMGCVDKAQEGAITVKGNEEEILFSAELWGQLTLKDVVNEACDILEKKLESLKAALEEIK